MEKLEGRRILVVEDDISLCNSILNTLHRQGHNPKGVTDLREAAFRMKNQKYDCLIIDMRLSNAESGEELIRMARETKDSLNLHTPILVISGYLDKSLVHKIARSIQGALVKPFEMKALLDLVSKVTSA